MCVSTMTTGLLSVHLSHCGPGLLCTFFLMSAASGDSPHSSAGDLCALPSVDTGDSGFSRVWGGSSREGRSRPAVVTVRHGHIILVTVLLT